MWNDDGMKDIRLIETDTMGAALWEWAAARGSHAALSGIHLDIRFMRPVRIGDTVTGSGTLVHHGERRTYEVWVKNQHGDVMIGGTATLRDIATARDNTGEEAS